MVQGPLLRLGARAHRQGRGKHRAAGSATTVADLIAWLASRGEEYAHAFEKPGVIRTAIDKVHVKPDAAIAGAKEIAFFPPMTGG